MISQKLHLPIAIVACTALASWAHPAKSVTLELQGDTLSVVALHKVSDPKAHFIGKISVAINDSVVTTKEYTEQTDGMELKTSVVLPAELLVPGSKITCMTVCNKAGSKEGKLMIEKKTE